MQIKLQFSFVTVSYTGCKCACSNSPSSPHSATGKCPTQPPCYLAENLPQQSAGARYIISRDCQLGIWSIPFYLSWLIHCAEIIKYFFFLFIFIIVCIMSQIIFLNMGFLYWSCSILSLSSTWGLAKKWIDFWLVTQYILHSLTCILRTCVVHLYLLWVYMFIIHGHKITFQQSKALLYGSALDLFEFKEYFRFTDTVQQ